MSRIPQSFIDDLLNRIDIVDVIDHRVKLKKSGKNFSACCPFHDEKTPSFTVSQDKQFYYCFGCGATGSALTFLIEYERLGFVDAVEGLARLAGVEVPREHNPRRSQQDSKLKALYTTLQKASAFFETQLKEHKHRQSAVKYLKNRGLSGSIAKDFGLGYAPPGWDNLISELGETSENKKNLLDSGLTIKKEGEDRQYDRFRHRIMFPIRDTRGRTIGFGGRVLGDDKPKYLNSPETEVFHKSTELYGLYEARQANRQLDNILIVEGYMDVIALAQYQISNAVATLGTACGQEHLKLAFKYTNEIIFCFDGDNAGRKAAKRALTNALESMEDGRQIKFLFVAEGQDPDSLVRQIGKDRFLDQTKEARPLEEFLFDVAAEDLNIDSMEGRARFSKIAAPLINLLPDGVFRQLMLDNLAKRTGLSTQVLLEIIKTQAKPTTPPESSYDQKKQSTKKKQSTNSSAEDNDHKTYENNISTDTQVNSRNISDDTSYLANDDTGYHTNHETSYRADQYDTDRFDTDHDNITPYDREHFGAHTYANDDIESYSQTYGNNGDDHRDGNQETQRPPAQHKSRLDISHINTAISLLLEQPQLLKNSPDITPLVDATNDPKDNSDPELELLSGLITYLRLRPEATQGQIIGYWRGSKGAQAQEALTAHLSHSNTQLLKTIANSDPQQELNDALHGLSTRQARHKSQSELSLLTQKGLENLDPEEKNRYRELIAQNRR